MQFNGGKAPQAELGQQAIATGITIFGIVEVKHDLEDMYLAITRREPTHE